MIYKIRTIFPVMEADLDGVDALHSHNMRKRFLLRVCTMFTYSYINFQTYDVTSRLSWLPENWDVRNPPLNGQLIPICDEKHSVLHGSNRRKIRLIESNVKCRYLKKFASGVFVGGLQHNPTPLHPLPVTHCLYIMNVGSTHERRLEGQ